MSDLLAINGKVIGGLAVPVPFQLMVVNTLLAHLWE